MTENNEKPAIVVTFDELGSCRFDIQFHLEVYPEQLLAVASKMEVLGKHAIQQQLINDMIKRQEKENMGKILKPQFTDIKQ